MGNLLPGAILPASRGASEWASHSSAAQYLCLSERDRDIMAEQLRAAGPHPLLALSGFVLCCGECAGGHKDMLLQVSC